MLVPDAGEVESGRGATSPELGPRPSTARTGGISYILQSLAHGRSHVVVLRSNVRLVGLVISRFDGAGVGNKSEQSEQSEH